MRKDNNAISCEELLKYAAKIRWQFVRIRASEEQLNWNRWSEMEGELHRYRRVTLH